ncbi:MAG TPA: hypothetical protein VF954_07300 [Acidimicrobiales bacterium]
MEFATDEVGEVVALMDELADGSGWINIRPAVDPDDLPPNGGRPTFISAVGPLVPLCTWTPAQLGRRPTPPLIGIQHAAGGKAAPELGSLGVAVPDGWRVVQDESRRGLVVAVAPSLPSGPVLAWLLAAGGALCSVPFSGWVAAVYRRTR